MPEYLIEFAAEVTDEQRLLNGTRLLALDGQSLDDTAGWSLSLSFSQPKEPGAPLLEADLTLSSAEGDLVGELDQGLIATQDGDPDAEGESLELRFRLEGEGAFAGATGSALLHGMLSGVEAHLQAEIRLAEA